jgi:hypothetical protein
VPTAGSSTCGGTGGDEQCSTSLIAGRRFRATLHRKRPGARSNQVGRYLDTIVRRDIAIRSESVLCKCCARTRDFILGPSRIFALTSASGRYPAATTATDILETVVQKLLPMNIRRRRSDNALHISSRDYQPDAKPFSYHTWNHDGARRLRHFRPALGLSSGSAPAAGSGGPLSHFHRSDDR